MAVCQGAVCQVLVCWVSGLPGVGLPVRTAVAGIVGVSLAAAVGWHNREFMPAGWKPW